MLKPTTMRLTEDEVEVIRHFAEHFAVSQSEIMRQLIRQASLTSFPKSWHLRVKELREREAVHGDIPTS